MENGEWRMENGEWEKEMKKWKINQSGLSANS